MTDLFEQSDEKLDAAITEIQRAIATGMANKQRCPSSEHLAQVAA